jgi:hypothetical protein
VFYSPIAETPDGNFNGDNAIDAADYVQWRKSGGATSAYGVWGASFGTVITGSGAGAEFAVPEPSSLLMCLAGLFATQLRRQRTR